VRTVDAEAGHFMLGANYLGTRAVLNFNQPQWSNLPLPPSNESSMGATLVTRGRKNHHSFVFHRGKKWLRTNTDEPFVAQSGIEEAGTYLSAAGSSQWVSALRLDPPTAESQAVQVIELYSGKDWLQWSVPPENALTQVVPVRVEIDLPDIPFVDDVKQDRMVFLGENGFMFMGSPGKLAAGGNSYLGTQRWNELRGRVKGSASLSGNVKLDSNLLLTGAGNQLVNIEMEYTCGP
jgi:hypothetical protein